MVIAQSSDCIAPFGCDVNRLRSSMSKPFNENLLRLLHLTEEMMTLADEGDRHRQDGSCGILYGILRDMAYRLRKLAQEECEKHEQVGKWD
jgi:hypothetical protein